MSFVLRDIITVANYGIFDLSQHRSKSVKIFSLHGAITEAHRSNKAELCCTVSMLITLKLIGQPNKTSIEFCSVLSNNITVANYGIFDLSQHRS